MFLHNVRALQREVHSRGRHIPLRTWPYVTFTQQVGLRSSFSCGRLPVAVAGSLNLAGMRTGVRVVYGIGRLLRLCRHRPFRRGVSPLQKILPRHDGFSFDFAHCEVESHTSGEPPTIMVERPNCLYDGRHRECFVLMPLLSHSRVWQFSRSGCFEIFSVCKLGITES